MKHAPATIDPSTHVPSLETLLGASRATIVTFLRDHAPAAVNEVAEFLGISAVATRRHLTILEEDGLVATETVTQGRGRPATRYSLTDAADRLLPHRYDELCRELLAFIKERHGEDELRAFFRWRMQREFRRLGSAVTAEDLHERLDQLAQALSAAGFDASIEDDDGSFMLVQGNCAIEGIAKEHPEVCSYEAAAFSKVLGRHVSVSRRQTLATGSTACVCNVVPQHSAGTDKPQT